MKSKTALNCFIIATCGLILQSCGTTGSQSQHHWLSDPGSNGYERYGYDRNYNGERRGGYRAKRAIVAENGYHLQQGQSPTSHKDRDRHWVSGQRSSHYTIEIARGEKASHVAGVLHKSPKDKRQAQVKHRVNNKTYYSGVYGSYKTKEEAKKAMSNLPESVRGSAKVKDWNSMQGSIVKEKPKYSRPQVSADEAPVVSPQE